MKPNKASLAAASIAALVTGCASADSRLIGRWHSNRPLTVASFPHRQHLSPARRTSFDSLFGRLSLTYSRRYIHSELPVRDSDQLSRQRIPYRVLATTDDSVTIETGDNSQRGTPTVIHFISPNRYWMPLPGMRGREYFDRVNQ